MKDGLLITKPDLDSAGMRQSPTTGLVLPVELSRDREVWTDDERRLLDRCEKLLRSRGVVFQLFCMEQPCRAEPMKQTLLSDGSFSVQCAHKDRILSKTSKPAQRF